MDRALGPPSSKPCYEAPGNGTFHCVIIVLPPSLPPAHPGHSCNFFYLKTQSMTLGFGRMV